MISRIVEFEPKKFKGVACQLFWAIWNLSADFKGVSAFRPIRLMGVLTGVIGVAEVDSETFRTLEAQFQR